MAKTREISKLYEYDDRKFTIKKMNPLVGLAILKDVMTRTMPIDLIGLISSAGADTSKLAGFQSGVEMKSMSRREFVELQKEILMNVSEKLESGLVQIIDEQGNFKIEGADTDLKMITKLLTETLVFNYADFFVEILSDLNLVVPIESDKKPQE